jgi:cyclohexanecarboxyl-CoA dehydrogenase
VDDLRSQAKHEPPAYHSLQVGCLERLLGMEGRGFAMVMHEFDYSRSLLGLMAIAVAEAAIEMAVAYARERQTFGRPIASYQGITFPIAEHLTRLEARAGCATGP